MYDLPSGVFLNFSTHQPLPSMSSHLHYAMTESDNTSVNSSVLDIACLVVSQYFSEFGLTQYYYNSISFTYIAIKRPSVSLTSTLGKLLESFIGSWILKRTKDQINDHQPPPCTADARWRYYRAYYVSTYSFITFSLLHAGVNEVIPSFLQMSNVVFVNEKENFS